MGSARYDDLLCISGNVMGVGCEHIYPDYLARLDLPSEGRFLPEQQD